MQMQPQGIDGEMIQRWLPGAVSWLLVGNQAIQPIPQIEMRRRSRADAERTSATPSTAVHDTTFRNSSDKLDPQ